jgi:hypothetical protein
MPGEGSGQKAVNNFMFFNALFMKFTVLFPQIYPTHFVASARTLSTKQQHQVSLTASPG